MTVSDLLKRLHGQIGRTPVVAMILDDDQRELLVVDAGYVAELGAVVLELERKPRRAPGSERKEGRGEGSD